MLPGIRDAAGDEGLDADPHLVRGDAFTAAATGAPTGLSAFELGERHGPGCEEDARARVPRTVVACRRGRS